MNDRVDFVLVVAFGLLLFAFVGALVLTVWGVL